MRASDIDHYHANESVEKWRRRDLDVSAEIIQLRATHTMSRLSQQLQLTSHRKAVLEYVTCHNIIQWCVSLAETWGNSISTNPSCNGLLCGIIVRWTLTTDKSAMVPARQSLQDTNRIHALTLQLNQIIYKRPYHIYGLHFTVDHHIITFAKNTVIIRVIFPSYYKNITARCKQRRHLRLNNSRTMSI